MGEYENASIVERARGGRRTRRLALGGILCGLAGLASVSLADASGNGNSANGSISERRLQPQVAGIDYCDFFAEINDDLQTPADCRAALIDPPGAHIIRISDPQPSEQLLAQAASDVTEPPGDPSVVDSSVPGNTGRDLTNLSDQESEDVFNDTARPVVSDMAPPALPQSAQVLQRRLTAQSSDSRGRESR